VSKSVLQIHPEDTIAVALSALARGTVVEAGQRTITLRDDIPFGHKVALVDHAKGRDVVKYGYSIGHATTDIQAGCWVQSHNLATNLSEQLAYSYQPVSRNKNQTKKTLPRFLGYRRSNGRVGTRNEIWVINTVGCVNHTAERIACSANERFKRSNFDGVFTFSHPFGCSQLGDDLKNTRKVLAGLMRNPNAGGILLLGLGCENNKLDELLASVPELDPKRLRSLTAQLVEDEVEEGVRLVGELFEAMREDKREECPASDLFVGMKCGGSDGFSGITGNPLVGRIADLVSGVRGKVVLTEVPEMFGAEQLLMNRAQDEATFQQIVELINRFKQYFQNHHQPVYENPSPGNKDGGITTLEEKSLGAVQKGGKAVVTQVLDYGEAGTTPGLILLNAPGNDGVSATAMTASGATMLLFTTGRGTPLGFPVPTVKISTNTPLFQKKPNWIDFNAGQLVSDGREMGAVADDLMRFILEVASGKIKTKNEINGYKEIAIWKKGVTL
jgi:altronate hydrolase